MLGKKVYAKIGALRRIKHLVLADPMLLLYRNFVLPYFEYCNSLLMALVKTLNKELEDANYYCLRTIMSIRKSTDCESVFRMLDMNTLIHEYIVQAM